MSRNPLERRKLCNICRKRFVIFDEVSDSGSLYIEDKKTGAPILAGFAKVSDDSWDEDSIVDGTVECYACWEANLPCNDELREVDDVPTYTSPMKRRR